MKLSDEAKKLEDEVIRLKDQAHAAELKSVSFFSFIWLKIKTFFTNW